MISAKEAQENITKKNIERANALKNVVNDLLDYANCLIDMKSSNRSTYTFFYIPVQIVTTEQWNQYLDTLKKYGYHVSVDKKRVSVMTISIQSDFEDYDFSKYIEPDRKDQCYGYIYSSCYGITIDWSEQKEKSLWKRLIRLS